MDGLTVSNAEGLISTGNTLGEIGSSKMKKDVSGASESGKSFADTLQDAVTSVNDLQKTADHKMEQLATGKAESIPDVMIAAEKADVALRLMTQVRNKIIDAYQEVMKMQV